MRANYLAKLPRVLRPSRTMLVPILLIAAGVVCLALGVRSLAPRFTATHHATIPISHQTVTVATDRPVETQPSPKQAATYTVPADQPRSISITRIKASGLIQRVGLTSDNAMATPNSIYFGGWYTGSVRPGDDGLSIIDGHVSGWYNDGIFKNLSKVRASDTITVEFGDMSHRTFTVVDVRNLPEAQAAAFLFQHRSDITKQLNLITCGGTFDRQTNQYANRIIVVAKRLS